MARTIPSLGWQAVYTPFDPIVMPPALVHDWLYSNHQVSKEDADTILRQLLKGNGVPSLKVDVYLPAPCSSSVRLRGEHSRRPEVFAGGSRKSSATQASTSTSTTSGVGRLMGRYP